MLNSQPVLATAEQLEAGSCLEEKNSSGQTALQLALELNHQEAAETLQAYAQASSQLTSVPSTSSSVPESNKFNDDAECSRSLITGIVAVDKVYNDSMANVDYVTRLRLSQRLDRDERWKKLAMQINCSHMVEFIDVCYSVDQTSPTMLLLDHIILLLAIVERKKRPEKLCTVVCVKNKQNYIYFDCKNINFALAM
ncbi:Palmitoyltransferase ZDHHC13 [Trichinella pseudospiralis]